MFSPLRYDVIQCWLFATSEVLRTSRRSNAYYDLRNCISLLMTRKQAWFMNARGNEISSLAILAESRML